MRPFNTLLVKEGVKELYEKTLQDKLGKALGTDILQNIEKIGGFGDILINTALSYQELISLKGMLLWDKKNAETDYLEFGGLNHYLYAGFAQLSYLNWHLLQRQPKYTSLKTIIENEDSYKEIRPDFTDGLYASKEKIINRGDYRVTKAKELLNKGKEKGTETEAPPTDYAYMIKLEGKEIPIYHADDRRSYYLYSETSKEPHLNPRFKEFREWEFVYAFDHNKILNSLQGETKEIISRGDIWNTILNKGEDTKNVSESTSKLDSGLLKKAIKVTKIGQRNSNFQASVFRNTITRKVMIAYRGTDASHLLDWTLTNVSLGFNLTPDALTCAVWVYEKVATDPELRDYEIHVTGHSMGGALTQYIGCYGLKPTKPTVYEEYDNGQVKDLPLTRPVYKSVTWNGLGIGTKHKFKFGDENKEKHLKVFHDNYDYCHNSTDKILNFYMKYDAVSDIQKSLGMRVLVDTIKAKGNKFIDEFACYHGLMCFLPFMNKNGNIVRDKLSRNFINNAIKQTVLKNDVKKNIKSSRKVNKYGDVDKLDLQESNYLEEFDITEIEYETALGSIHEDLQVKNKNGENLFYYMMGETVSDKYIDWYSMGKEYAEIGSFNNIANIAGVEGGLPLRIKLPQEVAPPPKDLERRGQNFLVNRLKNDSIEGFNFIGYRKFIMTQEIGRHNAFVIEGRVKEKDYDKYIKNDYYGKEICVKSFNVGENNEDVVTDVLIKGIINRIEFKKESPVDYFVKINGVSSSYLMDKLPKNRTYLNKEAKYEEILGELAGNYEDLNFVCKEESKIQKYFLQYRETDWQFLKRVCSNLGKPVIADRFVSENQQMISIGYFDETGNTESVYGYEDKLVSRTLNGKTVMELDKIMRSGTYVNLKKEEKQEEKKEEKQAEEKEDSNKRDERPQYFIKRVEAKLENEVINFYYTLVPNTEEEKLIKPYFNKKLAKATLLAQVIGVKEVNNTTEEIKINNNLISLNFDISYIEDFVNSETNSDKLEDNYLFPFVTEYSGGGSGSFSCPNVGEKVMVHYPNENEHEGIIICGKKEVYFENLHKPENKSWGNAAGQGYVANGNEGFAIYGNSITNSAESTSFANFKGDSIEFAGNKKDVNILFNKSAINLITGGAGIDLTEDSIIFKCGGKDTKIAKNSIEGFEGTLKINDTEITSKVKIINV